MILPTPEFDPMFARDGEPFRDKMLRYIEREFGDLLGERRALLKSEVGLRTLGQLTSEKIYAGREERRAAS